ncbi:MAG: nuclear transport factor 2 family protein [Saprospiraceae bacterium]|nr:nuclear transport factor 2 family protein [Saprospiraceae bacterium]
MKNTISDSTIIDEGKIFEVEQQLLEAMKKSDLETLEHLLHDDLLFVLPTGVVITKNMDLETYRSESIVFEEIESSIETMRIIDETAIVTLFSKLKGKMNDQSFGGQFRYIRVWKVVEGSIKIIAGSCISIPIEE